MAKTFYERLTEYYRQVGDVLRGQAAAASIFPNSNDVGTAREGIYAQFLEHHLPPGCQVMKGGFLFDTNGNESAQIDIIVTNEATLRFNMFKEQTGSKAFSCVEGCLAAVTVKSNMDSANLKDCLQNLSTIPPTGKSSAILNPSIVPINYDCWPLKIAYAPKGASLETLCQALREFYTAHSNIPQSRRIDIVHIAGVGSIFGAGEGFIAGFKADYTGVRGNYMAISDATDVGALAITIQNIQVYHAHSNRINYYYGHMLDHIIEAQYGPFPKPPESK